jgi:hypothetical protein
VLVAVIGKKLGSVKQLMENGISLVQNKGNHQVAAYPTIQAKALNEEVRRKLLGSVGCL